LVQNKLYALNTENLLIFLEQNNVDFNHFILLKGYAGWSAGQLDKEIALRDWELVPDLGFDLFIDNVQDLWRKLMQNLGGKHLLWANSPEDINLN
jgi:putative transcriptional regulator